MPGHRWWCTLAALLLSAVVLGGCAHERVRVMVPPAAPVEGITSIAILDFTNASADPGITIEFTAGLAKRLRDSGHYKILDQRTTGAILSREGLSPALAGDPAGARQLGAILGADALVVGEATYYLEDVSIKSPYRVGANTPTWYSGQETHVEMSFEVRVIETRSGAIVWSQYVHGFDDTSETVELDWYSSAPPHESLLPRPRRTDIPVTRRTALEKAVRHLSNSLLPGQRYEWRKKEPPPG